MSTSDDDFEVESDDDFEIRSNCARRAVSDALKALDELGIPHRVIEPPPKDDNRKEKYRP